MNEDEGNHDQRHENSDPVVRLIQKAGPRPAAAADRAHRVRAAVHEEWRTARPKPIRRANYWNVLAAAALVVLVVTAGLLWRRTTALPVLPAATLQLTTGAVHADSVLIRPGTTIFTGTDIITDGSARASFRLTSGASMRLDQDTVVRFHSPSVIEIARGAVYIDSGTDQRQLAAIEIRSPFGVVRDIGTQFEVRVERQHARIRVREGAIELARDSGRYEADAGTELVVQAEGGLTRRTLAPDDPSWRWILEVAPPFQLESATLDSFLKWAARELAYEVRYGSSISQSEAARIVLHGSGEGLTPDEALGAVLPITGMRSHVEGRLLIIERAE